MSISLLQLRKIGKELNEKISLQEKINIGVKSTKDDLIKEILEVAEIIEPTDDISPESLQNIKDLGGKFPFDIYEENSKVVIAPEVSEPPVSVPAKEEPKKEPKKSKVVSIAKEKEKSKMDMLEEVIKCLIGKRFTRKDFTDSLAGENEITRHDIWYTGLAFKILKSANILTEDDNGELYLLDILEQGKANENK